MSRDYQKIRYNCSLDRPPCLLDPGSITRAPRVHIHLRLAGSDLPRFALADLEIITRPSGGSRDSSTGRLIRHDHMCYWAAWTRELKPRTLRLVPNLSLFKWKEHLQKSIRIRVLVNSSSFLISLSLLHIVCPIARSMRLSICHQFRVYG